MSWKKLANEFAKNAQKQASKGGFSGGPSVGPPAGMMSGAALLGLAGATLWIGSNSLFTVEGGHRAVMFSRLGGVKKHVYGEGTHLKIPWLHTPTVFDVRTQRNTIRSPTGTRDLQMVDITLRVLYAPDPAALPIMLSQIGTNYDEKVLPSIVNETLKSVIAQYNASQLITKREDVSRLIKRNLTERARDFNIFIDDVSITHLTFGKEYRAAVEAKQVAQQDAERAKYVVKQALQDQKSTVIKATAEAKSAEMIGKSIQGNPGYLELLRMDAVREVSKTLAESNNKVYLNSENLLVNMLGKSALPTKD